MANNDIFAPPSPDELKAAQNAALFAPPSVDELKTAQASSKWYDVSPKGILQGAVNALPIAGGVAGGVLGTAGGPLGSVAGAGLGGAGGEALKQAIQPLLENGYNTNPQAQLTPESLQATAQNLGNVAKAGAEQATGQAGGAVTEGLLNKLLMLRGAPALKPNADAIQQASQSLGVQPTPGMLTKDMTTAGLESSLSQSPTLAGELMRKKLNPIYEGTQGAVQGLTDEATPLSQMADVGGDIKKGIVSQVENRYQPIQSMYSELEPHMQAIEVPMSAKKQAVDGLLSSDAAAVNKTFANQIANSIQDAQNLNQLKLVRSDAIKTAMDPQAPYTQKTIANDAISKINDLTENQATLAAQKIAGQGDGKDLAQGLLQTRANANKAYKGLMDDLQFISQRSGMGNAADYGPKTFIQNLTENYTPEEIPRKLFDLKDSELLSSFKEQFPDQYESARKLRLGQVLEASKYKDNVSPAKFLNQVKGMSSQAVENLFGNGKSEVIDSLKTVVTAMPEKIGPSGTPQGQMFLNFISNPVAEAKEMLRYANYTRRANMLGKPVSQVPQGLLGGAGQMMTGAQNAQ